MHAVVLTNPTSGKGRGGRVRDEAIPRLHGAGWRTTITLVNLDTVPASYTLRFYSNEGTLALPFDGETGRLESLSGTIAVGGSRTITTTGTTATLSVE